MKVSRSACFLGRVKVVCGSFWCYKSYRKMLTSLVLEGPVIFQLASFLKSVVEKN